MKSQMMQADAYKQVKGISDRVCWVERRKARKIKEKLTINHGQHKLRTRAKEKGYQIKGKRVKPNR